MGENKCMDKDKITGNGKAIYKTLWRALMNPAIKQSKDESYKEWRKRVSDTCPYICWSYSFEKDSYSLYGFLPTTVARELMTTYNVSQETVQDEFINVMQKALENPQYNIPYNSEIRHKYNRDQYIPIFKKTQEITIVPPIRGKKGFSFFGPRINIY